MNWTKVVAAVWFGLAIWHFVTGNGMSGWVASLVCLVVAVLLLGVATTRDRSFRFALTTYQCKKCGYRSINEWDLCEPGPVREC